MRLVHGTLGRSKYTAVLASVRVTVCVCKNRNTNKQDCLLI